MSDPRQYVYRVTSVRKVTDGDTLWLDLDVGFRGSLLVCVRLHACDTPERRGSDHEKAAASRATDMTTAFVGMPGDLWIKTYPDPDSFGRWLGDLWRYADDGSETHLATVLCDAELATVFPIRWHDVYG